MVGDDRERRRGPGAHGLAAAAHTGGANGTAQGGGLQLSRRRRSEPCAHWPQPSRRRRCSLALACSDLRLPRARFTFFPPRVWQATKVKRDEAKRLKAAARAAQAAAELAEKAAAAREAEVALQAEEAELDERERERLRAEAAAAAAARRDAEAARMVAESVVLDKPQEKVQEAAQTTAAGGGGGGGLEEMDFDDEIPDQAALTATAEAEQRERERKEADVRK
eukprot:3047442-Prymnesium_polylepis.1